MISKNYLKFLLSLSLVFTTFAVSIPQIGYAQTAQTQVSGDLAKSLQTIEEKVEKRRQELGIPGMSLVIVQDGKIIYMKGLGYKDFEKKIAVTPDTQFAIGSATKAFTGLSVLMSADEGKVNLDDSPKKYLPYFKMKDAETDAKMTVRDLMAHNSGLNRTDLAMITGKLNRQELIQVAGEAQPMAKFREKFFYQNIMFAAAGEVVAKSQNQTWESFVPARIFAPLGMTNSTMTIPQLEKAKDYSFGYEYNFDTKETRRLPFRPIDATNPAGSINSSARDMAKWITFVMDGGTVNGKRLVSEKGYDEWLKVQNDKLTPNKKVNYGLGWFLQDWNGLKVVQHGGNIDGFNSLVAMIPEKKLGFVMLTNVTGSPLGNELMSIVWENILGNPNAKTGNSGDVAKEVGKYKFEAANMDFEVKLQDGNLITIVPGQPNLTLENVGGRRYKVKEVEGFFVTFKDDSLYLEQPQGNYTLPKIGAEQKPANSEAAKELVSKYKTPTGNGTIEIKQDMGKVTLNIEGQQPYALGDKSKDLFNLSPLPDTYSLKVKRDANGKVMSIVIAQPEGEFEFKKADGQVAENKPTITVDELMQKSIEAVGGEENWRKFMSRVVESDIDLVNQGVKGTIKSYAKFPNKAASETTMTALGKTIAKGFDYFDGTNGEEIYSFAPVSKYAGKQLEDVKISADFYSLLNWKKNYKTVEIRGLGKVGDEECYIVDFTPEKGTKVTEFYSTKSFLLLKRNGVNASSTNDNSQPYTITFSDYRDIDGIKIAFKTVNSTPSMGEMVNVIKSVKHNVAIDNKMFSPHKIEFK